MKNSEYTINLNELLDADSDKRSKFLYKTDERYRKIKDNEIINKIIYNISNEIYDVSCLLEYAEMYIRQLIDEKPYILEFDVIIETLVRELEALSYIWNGTKNEIEKQKISYKKVKVLNMLAAYRSEFSDRLIVDYKKEKILILKYADKMKEGTLLSKKELEELSKLYLAGFIRINSDKFLDYIFKNLIEKKQLLSPFLYRMLFQAKCESILEKEGLSEVKLKIVRFNLSNETEASFSPNSKTISFNKSFIKSRNVLKNFLTFFHEKSHAKQFLYQAGNVKQLIYTKDLFMTNVSKKGYYESNYCDISFEKDAVYSSFEDLFHFAIEVAPSCVEETKKMVHNGVLEYKKISSEDTTERFNKNKVVNFNLLFESLVKEHKTIFTREIISNPLHTILLYEYDLKGNKKSIKELLAEKSSLQKEEKHTKTIELYNYLLYKEEVSLEYIIKNLLLLSEEKDKNTKKIISNVLEIKLLLYIRSHFQTLLNESKRGKNSIFEKLYERIVGSIESSRGIALPEKSFTKEEELKIGYQELMLITEEIQRKIDTKEFLSFQQKK